MSVAVGATAELPTGKYVGRYLILQAMPATGTGEVYAAYDPQMDRRVALTLIRSEGAQARNQLFRQAQAMARLSHPNVASVYDVGFAGEQVFVAMELVAGATLQQWLVDRPRQWKEVVQVFVEAGRGLNAAHLAGLAHREFQPTHVRVAPGGRVCLDG